MRLPAMLPLLMLWGASRFVEAATPLNLFRPDTGQRTLFVARHLPGGSAYDTISFWIASRSGDSAECRFRHSWYQAPDTQTLVWSQGRLTAPSLLKSSILDTNGIYSRQKFFPADFLGNTSGNRSRSGYTLQHEVDGYVFDTLLVACTYQMASDYGDLCDFVTPSGFFVYSNTQRPFRSLIVPDAAALAAMGGRPVSSPVIRSPLRTAVPTFRLVQGFDLMGRWRAAPSEAFPAAPEK